MLITRATILIIAVVLTLPGCKQGETKTATAQPTPTPAPNLQLIPVPSPIIGKPYPGIGVVKLINKKEGWIEIDHEPIEGLMPAMIMEWHVEPRSLMNKVKVGDKVRFTVVETGKAQLLTSLEKIKE
jgi:Cu/Ag efflux protein CusF